MTRWQMALRAAEILFLASAAAALIAVADLVWTAKPVLRDADYAVQNINRATFAIGSETATEEKLLQQQTVGFSETQARLNGLIAAAQPSVLGLREDETALRNLLDSGNELVKNTGIQVNAHLLPEAVADLKTLGGLESELSPTVSSLGKSAANLDAASGALAAKLPPTLDNVQQSSANLNGTMVELRGVAHNFELSSEYIREWIYRETRPIRGFWNTIKGLLAPAAHGADIWRAIQ